jgi:hypothetical protein
VTDEPGSAVPAPTGSQTIATVERAVDVLMLFTAVALQLLALPRLPTN